MVAVAVSGAVTGLDQRTAFSVGLHPNCSRYIGVVVAVAVSAAVTG